MRIKMLESYPCVEFKKEEKENGVKVLMYRVLTVQRVDSDIRFAYSEWMKFPSEI